MGEINLLTVCFVSFPEQLLWLIVSLLLIGRKDIFIFKNKKNVLKVSIISLMTTLIIILLKNLLGPIGTIISICVFIAIYVLFFQIHWVEAAAGILVTAIIFMTLEYVGILIVTQIIGITFNSNTTNSTELILLSVAPRILQIILTIILFKKPVKIIDTNAIKGFSKSRLKKLAFIFAYEAFCIFVIMKIARFEFNTNTLIGILDMWTNIILIITFVVGNLIVITRFMRIISAEKRNQAVTLLWVKSLLAQHGNDIATIDKMINDALSEIVIGGEYNER
jgi:hypothetical protein